MSKSIKPKVFSFDKNSPKSPSWPIKVKMHTSLKKELQLARLKLVDIDSAHVYSKMPLKSTHFALAVTARKKFSVCEVQETLDCKENRHQNISEKINLIKDFYARKKTLNKIKLTQQNKSFETIKISEDSTPKFSENRKIYHSFVRVRNRKPQSFQSILREHKRNLIEITIPGQFNQSCACIQTDELYL